MVNIRWLYPVLGVLLILGLLGNKESLTAGLVLAGLALVFTPDQLKIRAYRIFDRKENVVKFEDWLDERPDLADALQKAHNLTPDDFMTFCRLLVEIRYKKDQAGLEMIARQFRREKSESNNP